MHLVGCTIRIYYDARTYEHQIFSILFVRNMPIIPLSMVALKQPVMLWGGFLSLWVSEFQLYEVQFYLKPQG